MMSGTLYGVGIGPGDPELLTLKAFKAIQAATLLLVDDLVSDAIVAYAAPTARVVYVGKRGGCQSTPQAFMSTHTAPEAMQSRTNRPPASCTAAATART